MGSVQFLFIIASGSTPIKLFLDFLLKLEECKNTKQLRSARAPKQWQDDSDNEPILNWNLKPKKPWSSNKRDTYRAQGPGFNLSGFGQIFKKNRWPNLQVNQNQEPNFQP